MFMCRRQNAGQNPSVCILVHPSIHVSSILFTPENKFTSRLFHGPAQIMVQDM
jgi:hypothetical protein